MKYQEQGRSHWRGPTLISEQNKIKKFQFQTSGILLFSGGYYTAQKFHDFTMYATIFGQFTAAFHFLTTYVD